MFNIASFRMTQIRERLENLQKCKTLENHTPLRKDLLVPCSISPLQGQWQTPSAYKGISSSQHSCHHHRVLKESWGPCSAWWYKQVRIINRNSASYLEVLTELSLFRSIFLRWSICCPTTLSLSWPTTADKLHQIICLLLKQAIGNAWAAVYLKQPQMHAEKRIWK